MSSRSSQRSNSVTSDTAAMPPPSLDGRSATPSRSSSPRNMKQLIETLSHHRVNTVTELCRIERIAAACTSPEDARAFQGPMTRAWVHYVNSNQLLGELRGLTRGYPFSAELVQAAHDRVRADPQSNRSWNLAWLCLVRIRDDSLISTYSVVEASKPCMWGGMVPSEGDVLRLSGCFAREWTLAVSVMLKHWPEAPAWY